MVVDCLRLRFANVASLGGVELDSFPKGGDGLSRDGSDLLLATEGSTPTYTDIARKLAQQVQKTNPVSACAVLNKTG